MTLGKRQQDKSIELGACYSAMIQHYGCTDTYDGSVTDPSGPKTHAFPHLEMKIDEREPHGNDPFKTTSTARSASKSISGSLIPHDPRSAKG